MDRIKFYKGLGKYNVMFCVKSALGISWQHPNHFNLLTLCIYQFYVYFYVQIVLHHVGIPLLHENALVRLRISYIERVYCSIFDDHDVNADKI